MISKILIANRGEIACRIIRTCREMGIATVAVFSDADAEGLHTQLADEAMHIGEAPASASYLNIQRILEAADITGADAIHPGYGFLAENAAFAQAIIDAGLIWIGPKPETIAAMGDKRQAKLLLEDVVPVVPGYSGEDQSDETLIEAADTIGYPIMVKAAAGGGGKGMRQVNAKEALPEALMAARREAKNAFGDDTLILEHVVENPRHIEVQIVGDSQGRVIALGERECSVQRRHQKIIEETPSTALNDAMQTEMSAAAVRIGKKLGYIGAGTIEFLVGDGDKFYFMEMNTRLQVEHPVTEMVYGVDLVRWQILIAEGYSIDTISPTPPLPHGHAIEARIYAEDPENGFLPATGKVLSWRLPDSDDNVRVDSGVQTGDIVSTHYDPMIAKVIAYSPFSREEAIRKLANALRQVQLFGLQHNIDFLQRVLLHPNHLAGDISTCFLDEHPELTVKTEASPPFHVLIALALSEQPIGGYYRNNPNRPIEHTYTYNHTAYQISVTPMRQVNTFEAQHEEKSATVVVREQTANTLTLDINGHRRVFTISFENEKRWVHDGQGHYSLSWVTPLPESGGKREREGSLRAPMTGQIIEVMVEKGQIVKTGDVLVKLEAMKMEHSIEAPYDGEVAILYCAKGETVQADMVLLELTPAENES